MTMSKITNGMINKKGILTTAIPYGMENIKSRATTSVIISRYFMFHRLLS